MTRSTASGSMHDGQLMSKREDFLMQGGA